MKLYLFLFVTVGVFFLGCDLYPQDEYQEYYVVEAYMIAQNDLPPIFLSTTAPVSSRYTFEDYAVVGASVKVELLSGDENSTIQQTFDYQMDSAGVYSPISNHKVLPTRTYRLNISSIPGDEQALVKGFTTVPDTFSTTSSVPDSVVYQSENQIEIEISGSRVDDQQNFFIFSTIALNPSVNNFTPIYADLFDPEEDAVSDFVKSSSGIVNETNFEIKQDGTVILRYPWIAVAFYENNQIVANTIDQNIYDFVRSQSVQLGGSTLSPGEIPNVIYRLDGGIGVFGSIAADTIQTYIKRPQ